MKNIYALVILTVALYGCATNIDKNYDPSKSTATGIAVFSVTHDKGVLSTGAASMYFSFTGASLGDKVIMAKSRSDFGGASTDIEGVYGRIYALEFPAGKNQLTSWSMDNGTGLNVYPEFPPMPLSFEIKPGAVTYIGNFHGSLTTGTNFFGITIVSDANAEIQDQSGRDLPIVMQMYPQFAGKINIQLLPTGKWKASK